MGETRPLCGKRCKRMQRARMGYADRLYDYRLNRPKLLDFHAKTDWHNSPIGFYFFIFFVSPLFLVHFYSRFFCATEWIRESLHNIRHHLNIESLLQATYLASF